MINRRLSSRQAAERLGVKPATLYAYVSRGLLHPERTGRGSFFDLQEVIELSRTSRRPGGPGQPSARSSRARIPRAAPGEAETIREDPVFVTELTLIADGHLYYRGRDAVELSRSATFEEVAEWLWSGQWPTGPVDWEVPAAVAARAGRALADLDRATGLLERFMVVLVAGSLGDQLRHDLTPSGLAVTSRALLGLLSRSLGGGDREPTTGARISHRLWDALTGGRRAGGGDTERGVDAVEAALVLAADHELAPSTLAARVAASFRADPYAVVLTGLGPARGSSYAGSTGAPTEVEMMLAEATQVGVERAIGERLRRSGGVPHGFGMPLYPGGDPRGAELLSRLEGIGDPARLELVQRIVQLGAERHFPEPNFDLGLGALSFCADMGPGAGQVIFTLGKIAGWLAHAMEEYAAPTRFRSRADYVGVRPGPTAAS